MAVKDIDAGDGGRSLTREIQRTPLRQVWCALKDRKWHDHRAGWRTGRGRRADLRRR